MVVSAAVPAVVGRAMMGSDFFFVSATPSSDTMSPNSGFLTTIPMPFAVSIDEPPPMATMKSAFARLQASMPFFTFVTVGLGFTSSKIS